MAKIVYENKELCSSCGGICCKKSGCDYAADDFESLQIDDLQHKLEEGNISLVSHLRFDGVNNKIITNPFLYLRSRNINRPIVDLLSMKTRCASLLENGCKYTKENRPSGGLNLIPGPKHECYPLKEPFEIVKGWEQHQKTLARLVKRLTGKSVNQKLKEAIYNLFCDILSCNFEGVSELEIVDILKMHPILIQAYPTEYFLAQNDVGHNKTLSKTKNSFHY